MRDLAREAKEIIDSFAAAPRFAGSAAENRLRDECERRLKELGFATRRDEFTYSQLPAKLGPLICGLLFAGGMYLSGYLAATHDAPAYGIVAALMGVIITWAAGVALLKRTLTLSAMRAQSVNLSATRGASDPKVWLIAHTDSKSQTIRMLIRVASVGAAWMFLVLAIGTMVAQMMGGSVAVGYPAELVSLASGIAATTAAIAILPVAFCFIGNGSPGALDNGSGVAAVLLALGEIDRGKAVGVLFTSAEELGLAGARAFVREREARGIALNCDTIDEAGRFICMTSNRTSVAASVLARGGEAIGHPVKIRGMIRGILTDSIPFSQAGWDAVTLSRGNLGTLSAVHTSGDRADRVNGAGIALAARIIASTVEELA